MTIADPSATFDGWIDCDGSVYNISDYRNLYDMYLRNAGGRAMWPWGDLSEVGIDEFIIPDCIDRTIVGSQLDGSPLEYK